MRRYFPTHTMGRVVEAPTDADLIEAARAGDGTGLAVVLERHRAAMRAAAITILGWTPDVDDVVQDAMLGAIRGFGTLREPDAVGSWLRAITRNAARMKLRAQASRRAATLTERIADPRPSPDQILESHALRDWVWSALDELSEPLQQVVVLRYFSSAHSYSQIAEACGIPIGTVRSRLNQARAKLATTLTDTAEGRHGGTAALTARRRLAAVEVLTAAERGSFAAVLAELAAPDVQIVSPQRVRQQGREALEVIMESDLRAGVHQELTSVVAGSHVTIWECDLHSPAWDPAHCPPAVLWMLTHRGEQVAEIRLLHPVATTSDAA